MSSGDAKMDAEGLLASMNQAQRQWKDYRNRRRLPEFPESRVQLKLFVKESTWIERLRFYFVKNQRTSLGIRLFNFILKVCSVALYIFRAIYEGPETTTCCGLCARNWTEDTNPWWTNQYVFDAQPILWVERPFGVWIVQVILAVICFIHAIITIIVHYKGNLSQNILTLHNFLELICTVPFIVSLCWPTYLRCIFAPVFLNIWLANSGLNNMINDLQRETQKQKSAMFNQMCILLATILALLLTCICSVQQFERAGKNRMDMFDATWFVVVTFSTVGYGDIVPTIWPTRVAVMVTILVALSVLPSKIEDLAHLWSQRQKQGGEYSRQRATTEKHVIVCATELRLDAIMEFLNEFYAHPFFQKHYVVLLSPTELDGPLKVFLQIPIWAERVIYLQGSALRESDLMRAKLDAAEACFILTSRQEPDRDAADQKTILRAMACKEHASHCPLYVQILKPETKFHIPFADQVICDEEFKYALLAMNCYIPGLSTLVTMLAHTSKGREGSSLKTEWKRRVVKSAGNEIYHVVAEGSKFFGEYIGYRFAHASQLAHAKCGATLFGLKRDGDIRINPGFSCVIENMDVLFYICLTGEEDAVIVNKGDTDGEIGDLARTVATGAEKALYEEEATRRITLREKETAPRLSSSSVEGRSRSSFGDMVEKGSLTSSSTSVEKGDTDAGIVIGFPPIFPYIGHVTPTMCHILKERKMYCCLRHDRRCTHPRFDQSNNGPIIIYAEFATQSLINAMIPLRAHYRTLESLNPVVLVLEHSPEDDFLESISCFPMVYYMLGNMGCLDSLLVAGIMRAHMVITIDRMSSVYAEEEYMADSRQLVAAQTIFKLFPTVRTCLDLTHSSNMRFNRFSPSQMPSPDELQQKRRSQKAASLPYLFCESFASGEVFSSSMLDTLLYQSMVKSYLMTLLRLLLGLQYGPGSGYLSTHHVTKFEDNRKYSSIFKEISYRTGGIVLGIYRKEIVEVTDPYDQKTTKATSAGETSSSTSISEPQTNSKKHRNSLTSFSVKKSLKSKLNVKAKKHVTAASVRRLQLMQHNMTEREKLDNAIQARLARLGISTEQSTPKLQRSFNGKLCHSFGYVLLNPVPDVTVKRGDILYIIEPEVRTQALSENMSDSTMDVIDELGESASVFYESDSATPPSFREANRPRSQTSPDVESTVPVAKTTFEFEAMVENGSRSTTDITTLM